MSYPPFDNESWEEFYQQSLVWNGTGWYYDGEYGGCDGCPRYMAVNDESTWVNGYVPNTVSFTITTDYEADYDTTITLSVVTTEDSFGFQSTYESAMWVSPGTYTLTIPLVDAHEVFPGVFTSITNYLTGALGEIIAVGFHIGISSAAPYHDRPFTITDLSFLPDPSATPFKWTSFVKTAELNVDD